jgi:hypothetical protein
MPSLSSVVVAPNGRCHPPNRNTAATHNKPTANQPLYHYHASPKRRPAPLNARVSRATAKPLTSWATPAEQPTPFQAQTAAAVASDAPFVGHVGARPLSPPPQLAG